MNFTNVTFPFGRMLITIKLPSANIIDVVKVKEPVGFANEVDKIKKSVLKPVGTKPLHESVIPDSNVAILVSDITRPVPSQKITSLILDELDKARVPDSKIRIVVATGLHRPNTENELKSMLGKDIFEKMRVINHDAYNRQNLTYLGKTSRETPLEVNSIVSNADVKIAIGYIEPHEFAGFTGGRKSILPGVSGADSINWNHRPEMLDHPRAKIGVLDGNPIHEDMVEAAKMVGLDFIVNVVLNTNKEVVKVVSGDFIDAHKEGVAFLRQYATVKIARLADIAITSSGHPLDIDLYQSIKSIVTAQNFVKNRGTIILLAECSDGVGPPEFYRILQLSSSPDELRQKVLDEKYSATIDHCYVMAQILQKYRVIVVSQNPIIKKINNRLIETTNSVGKALSSALDEAGNKASIIGIPYATSIIPY